MTNPISLSVDATRAPWVSVEIGNAHLFFSYGKLMACHVDGSLTVTVDAEIECNHHRARQLALWRQGARMVSVPRRVFHQAVYSAIEQGINIINEEIYHDSELAPASH